MPITSAYRRGDRLVVAVNVRKQTAAYSETSATGGDWSAANNRDYGYSGLLIVDGQLANGAYVVTRSHLWELETETDQRLVPMRWHNEPAPFDDQVWALYQGVASNDIRPSVVIGADGNLFGCAVVNVTRTAEQGTGGFITEEMLAEVTPAQAFVYWTWPAPSDVAPSPAFTREVKEAYLHYSGAKVYELLVNDAINGGSEFVSRYPWLQLYQRTAAILDLAPVPPSPDPATYRQYMEQEAELFIESFTLATTDDSTWQLSVVYHRFKMASIGQVDNVPIHQPGMICAADLPNNTQVCVPYPTLYKRIELPDWVEYTWDGTGLKVNRYPFLNQSTYIRGVPYAALGVDATTVAASRGAVLVEPGQWVFYGYPFDSLDINTFRISLMNDDGVTHQTPPPDVDLPGSEVNVPRLAAVQRQITGEDEGGNSVVTKQYGVIWTPGSRGFVTNTSADKWARIYTDNLGQIAFVGNRLWTFPQGRAAEIPGDSDG